MSEQDSQQENRLKDKLEEIGRRLTQKRSREELEEIQLELTVLARWDQMISDAVAGHHHHHHRPVEGE